MIGKKKQNWKWQTIIISNAISNQTYQIYNAVQVDIVQMYAIRICDILVPMKLSYWSQLNRLIVIVNRAYSFVENLVRVFLFDEPKHLI